MLNGSNLPSGGVSKQGPAGWQQTIRAATDGEWSGQLSARLLREVLGNSLPDTDEKYFRRLLGRKDEINYGARSAPHDEAERLIAELHEFAAWAEGVL